MSFPFKQCHTNYKKYKSSFKPADIRNWNNKTKTKFCLRIDS